MTKTVLITGATKGIGLATTQLLLQAGWNVIGIARGQTAVPFPGVLFSCDLAERHETASTLVSIASKWQIDAVVNNVGIALAQSLEDIELDTLQKVYDLNVRTAIQITQAFVPMMKAKGWGRIINMASRAIFGVKDLTSYAAAKSALIGCTRTWALELGASGITVNAIAPGPIDTELYRQRHPIGSQLEKETLAAIPMLRVGKPSEIAAAIVFLLSDEAGFITGQTLCIDGGASL